MKIVICGGNNQASYIVGMFKQDKRHANKLIIINDNEEYAQTLSNKYQLPVLVGDYTKTYTLDDADIIKSDIFIALGDSDTDNYIACLLAKNTYHCKKVISSVTNPANVSIFKKLGIDSAISSSFLIGQTIKNESNIEDVFKTLSLEDDMIKIIEIDIKNTYDICNKELKDIHFPEYGTISAIYRKPHIIIPKGKTDIRKDDRLIMIASPNDEESLIKFVTRIKKQTQK